MPLIGGLFGQITFGLVIDNFGRRIGLYCLWMTVCVGLISMVLSDTLP